MARPIKKGIDYFPLDVTFLRDMKIRKIRKACGDTAITMLIYLLGTIYQDEGYYMKWDDDVRFLVADDVGASESAVDELVNKALKVDFFNKKMFDDHKILTSHGIQTRYQQAAYKKKDSSIDSKYCLISDTEKKVSDTRNSINDNDSTQSKEKETKGNESKGEEIILNQNKENELAPLLKGESSFMDYYNRFAVSDRQIRQTQVISAAIPFLNRGINVEELSKLMKLATQIAIQSNALTWEYVKGILKNWYKIGIRSSADVPKHKKQSV
ncbi:Lin1244/Lin1753 domain-containing protein [Companilactobacillus muriivasis]|uniref:Lin1244/Lin1753 domain-containing protein n=1 Tax=Companilactobacillus muriivasis TaxID=3081444 RepID=UPI0030C6E85E